MVPKADFAGLAYRPCAIAFQAVQAGSTPAARSNFCFRGRTVVGIRGILIGKDSLLIGVRFATFWNPSGRSEKGKPGNDGERQAMRVRVPPTESIC